MDHHICIHLNDNSKFKMLSRTIHHPRQIPLLISWRNQIINAPNKMHFVKEKKKHFLLIEMENDEKRQYIAYENLEK